MNRLMHACISVIVLALAVAPTRAQESSLVEVFKRVNPAVVEIHTQETYPVPGSAGGQVRVSALGSGVLISRDGKILTAAHVVQMADVIEVEFLTGERFPARVISSEPQSDLAYLKLDRVPRESSVAVLGDSDRVDVGATVFVIGAPLGLSHSLTVGHVSGHHREDVAGGAHGADLLQTDAALNEGNSGGPLFNMNGEVIGIVSRILTASVGSGGVGFAVSSNVARRLLEEKSFWSGFESRVLTGDLASVFNLPPPGVGLLVERVAAGSPAERAGLQGGRTMAMIGDEELIVGGDIVLSFMGVSLDQPDGIAAAREKAAVASPGQAVEIVILRGGRTHTLISTVPSQD